MGATMIRIEAERCNGCGSCVAACPAGALSISETGLARIDQMLCTGCRACVDVCPNGALTVVAEAAIVVQRPEVLPVAQVRVVEPLSPPWYTSVLAFAGQAILPRLADVLLGALERRLEQPSPGSIRAGSNPGLGVAGGATGCRRNARRRGGRMRQHRNQKGR